MAKKRRRFLVPLLLLLLLTLVSTAFGIDEGDVHSAVTEQGKEAVAGNIFIWFLCAIGFLKISQKIDSFLSALGINTARTGGSMLGELMIVGRTIAGAAGTSLGGMFHRGGSPSRGGAHQPPAGSACVTNQFGQGIIGMAQQSTANQAASAVTGKASGLSGAVGSQLFKSSLHKGGQFATDVVHSVATGEMQQMGTMTGAMAAGAMAGYMGYAAAAADEGASLIDAADAAEHDPAPQTGGPGAQPPVAPPVPVPREENIAQGAVPPVPQKKGAPAASRNPVKGTVAGPVGSPGTKSDNTVSGSTRGGAASPYTPMGMDAGATIPREPVDAQSLDETLAASPAPVAEGSPVSEDIPQTTGY